MYRTVIRNLMKPSLFVMLLALEACAPGASSNITVASAYETSDVMMLKPYTRTIFSSHNF